MTTNPSGWRDRLRRRGFTHLVDQALDVTFPPDDDDLPLPADQVEETPRLARGIVWSEVVAEMERDHAARETVDLPEAA